jgi:hypothetical protein
MATWRECDLGFSFVVVQVHDLFLEKVITLTTSSLSDLKLSAGLI